MFKNNDYLKLIKLPNGDGKVGTATHSLNDTYIVKEDPWGHTPGLYAYNKNNDYLLLVDTHKTIWYDHFELTQSTTKAHKFNVGDKVRRIDRKNNDYIIVQAITATDEYRLKYEHSSVLGFCSIDKFEATYELVSEEVSNPNKQINKCSCDSRTIFSKGCQCGAFKAELQAKVSNAS